MATVEIIVHPECDLMKKIITADLTIVEAPIPSRNKPFSANSFHYLFEERFHVGHSACTSKEYTCNYEYHTDEMNVAKNRLDAFEDEPSLIDGNLVVCTTSR